MFITFNETSNNSNYASVHCTVYISNYYSQTRIFNSKLSTVLEISPSKIGLCTINEHHSQCGTQSRKEQFWKVCVLNPLHRKHIRKLVRTI